MTRSNTPRISLKNDLPWIITALGAHTGWGAYPVLARYLQTISQIPSMSLIAGGSLVVLIVSSIIFLPKIGLDTLRSRLLWVFAGVVFIRAVTNMLAARFTLAIYVQLITLMTPFLVALLSVTLFRDHIPAYTGRAILITLMGAILMMSGNENHGGIQFQFSNNDLIGISLAITSSFSLATYMLLVRRTGTNDIPAEGVFIIQFITLASITPLISLTLGEDWSRWLSLGIKDWIVFAALVILVMIGANFGQINALRHLGAPMVSSMMAWRLVSAIIFGTLLLGERLTSYWQISGAIIVLITITWYLWQQR